MKKAQYLLPFLAVVLILIFVSPALILDRYFLYKVESSISEAENLILNRKIDASGLFIYDYDLEKGRLINYGYGIEVRMMGSLYALSLLLSDDRFKNEALLKGLEDSLDKVLDSSYSLKKGAKNLRLLTYHKENKLGSLALLYSAAIRLGQENEDWYEKHKEEVQEILNTIIWMQKKNGDFAMTLKDSDNKDEINKKDGSGFALGEAMLALVHSLLLSPENNASKEALLSSLEFLETRVADNDYPGLYLWLMSAARLLQESSAADPELKKELADFAMRYHQAVFGKLIILSEGYNTCAHTEGLANYILLQEALSVSDPKEIKLYKESLRNNMKLQIVPENYEYLLKHNNKINKANLKHKYASGAFLDSLYDESLRIDFTQHCIAAFLPSDEILQ